VRRVLALVSVALLGSLVWAPPADAHAGRDASNYHSEIDGPVEPGLRWRVLANDALLELRNDSGAEVVVLGYEGEPYLRFTDDGVFENRRSPAAYLNADRDASDAVPDEADADAAPRWRRVAGGQTYRWHDHRIHWMSPQPPAAIRRDLGRAHVVGRWQVAHRVDGRPATLEGTLRWEPSDPWWPWYVGVGAVTGLVVLAGLRAAPRRDRWPALARPVAVLLLVATAGALVRTVDDVLAVPGTDGDAAASVGVALVTLLAVVTSWRGWRGDDVGLASLALGGISVASLEGVAHATVLSLPELVTGMPPVLTRLAVAGALAAGAAAIAAAVLGWWRMDEFLGRRRTKVAVR